MDILIPAKKPDRRTFFIYAKPAIMGFFAVSQLLN
jgi:hypothetical protein